MWVLILAGSESYLNPVFLQAPLTLLGWVMVMLPHDCEVGVEVQVLYSAFIDQGQRRAPVDLFSWCYGESHGSPYVAYDTIPAG